MKNLWSCICRVAEHPLLITHVSALTVCLRSVQSASHQPQYRMVHFNKARQHVIRRCLKCYHVWATCVCLSVCTLTVRVRVESRSALFTPRTLELCFTQAASRGITAFRERADWTAATHCRQRQRQRHRETDTDRDSVCELFIIENNLLFWQIWTGSSTLCSLSYLLPEACLSARRNTQSRTCRFCHVEPGIVSTNSNLLR